MKLGRTLLVIYFIILTEICCKLNYTSLINNSDRNLDVEISEENRCSSTFPESKSECTNIIINTKRGDYSCCLFVMSKPNITKTCVPILSVFLPINNQASKILLPGNEAIEGIVDCKCSSLFLNLLFLILFIIFYLYL